MQKTKTPKSTTKQDPKAQASENLIKRDFTADAPGKKLLGDISEVACKDGILYIAPVLDCFDGAIVGLSMDCNKKAELCENALIMAHSRYEISDDAIFHSDRGSQYTSRASTAKGLMLLTSSKVWVGPALAMIMREWNLSSQP